MARSTSSTLSASSVDPSITAAADRIVHRLLNSTSTAAALRLWNGVTHSFGQGASSFTLILRDPGVLREIGRAHV